MNDTQSDYVFLSYSHKDNVEHILEFFASNGYNVVFDDVLSAGEEWNLRVRRYINNERCKGIVCLASMNSIVSPAVLTELDYTRLYNKNTLAIVKDADSIQELVDSVTNDHDRNIASFFAEYFPSNKIYVSERLLEKDMTRIFTALEKWGMRTSKEYSDYVVNRYDTLSDFEVQRLDIQQRGYQDLDSDLINGQVSKLDRKGLLLLDLGCSDGNLTHDRFAGVEDIDCVIGVDINQRAIESANRNYADDKFHFYTVDLNDPECISQIRSLVQENGHSTVDIAFAALTLHHLKNPPLLLLSLYDILSEDGRVIIRESDDRGKNCYPKGDLLSEFLDRYDKLLNDVNNRKFGRSLYKHLYDSGYVDIEMRYVVRDTCQMNRATKEQMFQVGFGYRYNQLKRISDDNPGNDNIQNEVQWQLKTLDELKAIFLSRDFWYMNTTYIATAGVR